MSFSADSTENEQKLTYQIFVEQQHLARLDWAETSRWIRFEENVENGSNKWSKPYLPVMSVMAIQKITDVLTYGYVLCDIECSNYIDLINQLIATLIDEGRMSSIDIQVLREMLMLPHLHQATLAQKKKSSNRRFESKLPEGMEACAILSGEIKGLVKPICVFIRLKNAIIMNELVEVAIPTRFVFIYLTNHDGDTSSNDIGRAFGALITDSDFLRFCYEETNLYRMNVEIDLYLRKCFILPPVWNPKTRISPSAIEEGANFLEEDTVELQNEENYQFREDSGLVRTGECFGGLIRDVKRKLPFYKSDFSGLCSTQVISSTLFMYFACLTALITFGGLLAKGTGNNMAAIESIAGAFANGIIYGLFSGQPLSLLGSTGPMMIYESIVFEMCVALGWDYITLRFWIGMWVTILLMILVATDASALMSYVTRFTEESFALVVCAIFITTPMKYLKKIGKERVFDFMFIDYDNVTYCNEALNDTRNATDCLNVESYDPSSFLMSLVLVVFTCAIALVLTNFKNTTFFAFKLRSIISEFAVFGTVLVMCIIDFLMGLETDKLPIPDGFSPTLPTRGWIISPFHEKNPWYCPFAAIVPAIVATILVFMNNQITISVICRKDNLLRKGVGYHLDLFLITILIFVNSIFGLPWFNAAILLSIGHLQSLRIERPPTAPGAMQQFIGHNEQRLTHILVSILLGASIFLSPLLKHVPMPVLYGVFLYMGVTSITKLQLTQRILLFFMPVKYMPDYPFLRKVSLKRVHLFTIAQFATFALLWAVKSFSETALLFPACLIIMVVTRKCLENCFSQEELRALDDLLPKTTRKRRGKSYIMANRVPTTIRRKVMVH
ncbi:electroneutral sodium bicarbonate exchanger 1-like [Culicoides brevitarsis]|uniref:electroneutral sodium bicarbonate exchanger 1-like n=1 Tax=Culicoides brevitarsis TaxID=469753 RepID=UPI00307C18C5